MNWRRGLFRLWLVGAALWALLMIWIEWLGEQSIPAPPPGFVLDGGFRDFHFWIDKVFGPPDVAGILLFVAAWAISGFMPNRRRLAAKPAHPSESLLRSAD